MSADPRPSVVEFGPFRLDTPQGFLTRSGEVIPLEPKVVDTLVVLVEAEGRLVTKQDLMERVWPGTFVEEGSLSRNVSALRRALGDTAEEPHYIETVPRRGYRFRAPVRRAGAPIGPAGAASIDATPAVTTADGERTESGESPAPRRYWVYWVGAALLLTVSAGAAVWRGLDRAGGVTVRAEGVTVRAMAVLPLRNFTGRTDLEFVADGTTEELISTLAQIPSLRVVGHRTVATYKTSSKPAGAIARELGVDVVLEGAVRESNGRLRVSAELVDAATETSLWAKTLEGSVQDLLAIQAEIAKAVATVVARGDAARMARVSRPRTTSAAAYEEILKGHEFSWRDFDDDTRKAIAHYQRAVELDPDSAIAHAYLSIRLGNLSGSSGIEPSRQAALRALALDPDLPEAHAAMAGVHYRDFEWEAGHDESRRALALNPSSVDGCYCFVIILAWTGRDREALAIAEEAVKLNPRWAQLQEAHGQVLYWGRRYGESVAPFRRALALNPNAFASRVLLAHALAHSGKPEEALTLIAPLRRTTFMAFTLLRAGRRDEGLRLLRELTNVTPPIESNFMASAWAYFGDRDQAISWLTRAVETREGRAASIIDPAFDALRTDPRFEALAQRLKMPASYYEFLRARGVTATPAAP